MEENTILVGLDIHEYVKGLCEKFLAPTPDMNEREKLKNCQNFDFNDNLKKRLEDSYEVKEIKKNRRKN